MTYQIVINSILKKIYNVCFIFIICIISPAQAKDHIENDQIWHDYGINCVYKSPIEYLARLPIALFKNDFKNGFAYFARDENFSYFLWSNPVDSNWYLYREKLDINDKNYQNYQLRLEQFLLTKATSTCDTLELFFFKVPLNSHNIGTTERKILVLKATLIPGKSENNKGEFDDPVFYTFGLKVKMSVITPSKTDFLSNLNFDRTDKILKRYSMKLSGTTIDQLKLIEVISKDICEYMSTKEWIRNLPVAECIKHLQGQDSVIDQLKK